MTFLYLASFLAGLLLAVRVMMYGVERPREESPTGERSFRLSPAVIVVFLITFGVTGYILTRRGITTATTLGVGAGLGVVLSLITAHFVKKWWTITPEHDVDDVRYVLQGHIARVTKAIQANVEGEVTYELGAQRHVMRAQSFDGADIAAGTEVVIERIEGDLAYVEAWMEVEKRL